MTAFLSLSVDKLAGGKGFRQVPATMGQLVHVGKRWRAVDHDIMRERRERKNREGEGESRGAMEERGGSEVANGSHSYFTLIGPILNNLLLFIFKTKWEIPLLPSIIEPGFTRNSNLIKKK